MKILTLLLVLALAGGQQSCGQQGIAGEVLWLSGNQMPGPGKVNSPGLGVKREIYIHKVATLKDTEQRDGFFSEIRTELVTTVTSASNGSFKVDLPPGEYSVFVKEAKGFFANLFNDKGQINPVVVKPGEFTWLTITVDYEAAY